MAFCPTDEQRAAIDARGGSLLLSAAAGSGKTAVLTHRALSRMLDKKDPIPADRLLIVTFTRAAAAEMKSRIVQLLAEYIASNPDDRWARRQRTLIDRATIGTIDSLCTELLRQNFQRVDIPSAFRVGDTNEIDAMQQEAVSAVLEEAYREGNEHFIALSRLLSSSRSDERLASVILKILDFARSHPFYRRWLENTPAAYRAFSSPEESIWGEVLFSYSIGILSACEEELASAIEDIARDETLTPYSAAFAGDLAAVKNVKAAALRRDWDGCLAALSAYKPERLGTARKAQPEVRDAMKDIRSRAKALLTEGLQQKAFCADSKGFSEDIADLLPKIEVLFSLVLRVDERLQNEKSEHGILDFSDVEQLCCALLTDEKGALTPVAEECRRRWDEVMVDEFQDVNEVQNSILTAVARENNLFCVGDVKQSIYRFRMAQPGLFLKREKYSHPYDGENFPAVLRLNGSFRTAPEVTDIVNGVFSSLMSEEAGEITYDERHRLVPLAQFPEGARRGVDLCLIENARGEDPEPEWAAAEIARILREEFVSENGKLRRAEPRDIAILMRSPRAHGEHFRKALAALGIDSALALDGGFLHAPEVNTVLNALTAISNPMRDVELLGAMSSPLFGFTDDEIAAMRINCRGGRLWSAVVKSAEENPHAAEFVNELRRLRDYSLSNPPAALIDELLRSTGFDVLCRSVKNSEAKSANLALLIQYAADSAAGIPTLEGFLRRVQRLRERGKDLPPACVSGGENAVTITSIHRSKGLEWPIVFVSGLHRNYGFYYNEMNSPVILHSSLGFACVRRDDSLRRQFVTVPLAALRVGAQKDFLSEEMRVLYVAMTRARERLFLTGNIGPDAAKKLRSAAQSVRGREALLPGRVLEGKNYFDWLLPALLVGRELPCEGEAIRFDDGLSIRVCSAEAGTEDALPECEDAFEAALPDEALERELLARASYEYPFQKAFSIPAKLSVSELSHGSAMHFASKPAFMSEGKLTGAAGGTAVHAFFQYCDYAAAKKDPEAELLRMKNAKILTESEADAVDIALVRAFFDSELAKRVFAADKVLREFRFMAPASCSELSAEYSCGEESAMLQGVADCIIIENGEAVVIDYKTDKGINAQKLEERYRTQLLLYRDMLEYVLGLPVKECIIYSFALKSAVPVKFS